MRNLELERTLWAFKMGGLSFSFIYSLTLGEVGILKGAAYSSVSTFASSAA